jgi:hypothetical protein
MRIVGVSVRLKVPLSLLWKQSLSAIYWKQCASAADKLWVKYQCTHILAIGTHWHNHVGIIGGTHWPDHTRTCATH